MRAKTSIESSFSAPCRLWQAFSLPSPRGGRTHIARTRSPLEPASSCLSGEFYFAASCSYVCARAERRFELRMATCNAHYAPAGRSLLPGSRRRALLADHGLTSCVLPLSHSCSYFVLLLFLLLVLQVHMRRAEGVFDILGWKGAQALRRRQNRVTPSGWGWGACLAGGSLPAYSCVRRYKGFNGVTLTTQADP